MKYVPDTHVWIWWHMRPQQLSEAASLAIADAALSEELLLSAISPWEFCKLLGKGMLAISCAQEWMALALDMPHLRLVPLTPRIAHRSTCLPAPFHDDPADQIITATAREENATIVAGDPRLRGYPHVRTLW
ncbi:MAG: type II toxin-antitoxin system VapC family toxin [Candidatus Latescibacterota bacterium]